MVEGLSQLLGKSLLVGVSFRDSQGHVTRRLEFIGRVREVAPVVVVERPGLEPFALPPKAEAFAPEESGTHTPGSTGEVIIDPDFTTTRTVEMPDGAGDR